MDELSLAAELLSVALARDFVRAALAGRDVDTWVVELLTSELATNVVRHAESAFTVMIAFDEHVRVEIHDGAAATATFRDLVAHPPAFSEDRPGGRGLPLVHRLSSRFGLDDEPGVHDGKIVWFEVEWSDLDVA
jgi:anti-sigma regulatory factor (Ser/Thr protein kinase)